MLVSVSVVPLFTKVLVLENIVSKLSADTYTKYVTTWSLPPCKGAQESTDKPGHAIAEHVPEE